MELRREYMKRDILEVEVDRVGDAMEVLLKAGIENAIFGSALHVTVDDAGFAALEIRRTLESSGISVKRVEKIVPSLEDVFVTLIEVA